MKESSDQSLPEQWEGLQQRITHLQIALCKVIKRNNKLQLKISEMQSNLAIKIDKLILETEIRSNKNEKHLTNNLNNLQQQIQSIKKDLYNHVELNSRKLSPKNISDRESVERKICLKKKNLQQYQSEKSPKSERVSYLKQKLKQFEQINKKYQHKNEQYKVQQRVVQKMKNIKNYLQQSDSELQISQLDQIPPQFEFKQFPHKQSFDPRYSPSKKSSAKFLPPSKKKPSLLR